MVMGVFPVTGRDARPGAPLFCSERRNADGSAARAGNGTLRADLTAAAAVHLPGWPERVTPHVLRHFCVIPALPGRDGPGRDPAGPRPCLGGHDHELHQLHATHVEDAWIAGQQRAAGRLKGLGP